MKIVGIILIIVGVVDVGGSWLGFDLWRSILGFDLPWIIWFFSGWVELGLGYFLFNLGSDTKEEEDPDN